jgi:Rrf2 family protein
VSISSRFVVAVHVLTLLEFEGEGPITSEYIAASVNTNPGFIRRLLSMLGKAGLVTSQLGSGGGARLAKPANAIRLDQVYRAVESSRLFSLHHSPPSSKCQVGRHIQGALGSIIGRAERSLEQELGSATIADLAQSIAVASREHLTP